jgi:hypothetical protein
MRLTVQSASLAVLALALSVCSPSLSYGRLFAYIIGTDGSVIKLDPQTDSIVTTTSLKNIDLVQSEKQSVVADTGRNLLYVTHGRLTSKIQVFDLRTLNPKSDLGIVSGSPDVRIIVPPMASRLYVNWWDKARNQRVMSAFDTQTLTRLSDVSPISSITDSIMYSSDHSKLYSVNDGEMAKIDVFDTSDLHLVNSIPLNNIFSSGIFGRGVSDLQNERLLIVENVKQSRNDPSRYAVYTYSISGGSKSPRIVTGIAGEAKLSQDATRILLNEKTYVYNQQDHSVEDEGNAGRIHVYGVAEGRQLGVIQLTADGQSEILAIHPNGTKAYLSRKVDDNASVVVMDIVNFRVIKSIKVPPNGVFWVFYDE